LNTQFRIGLGYDVHQFDENRKLVLGGIEIPFEKGLLGHSDADVLLHAICDAMLGALSLGDIGKHFPNTDPAYKDADSKELLRRVNELIAANGYVINNIDSTVILERPKLINHVPKMRKVIADILKIGLEQISIKATTNEGMGFIGKGEGCAAHAVVLLIKKEN
jgi:2-C-methyl-D-erythritol 2,4-cyclodiphosphate synthase